jgi:Holliday junction resolvase
MADITAVVNGKHVSIEVKTGRDKPRPEQMKVKQQIEHAGGIYIFVRTFEDFLEQIQQCEE